LSVRAAIHNSFNVPRNVPVVRPKVIKTTARDTATIDVAAAEQI
jgi:hypothetical protein